MLLSLFHISLISFVTFSMFMLSAWSMCPSTSASGGVSQGPTPSALRSSLQHLSSGGRLSSRPQPVSPAASLGPSLPRVSAAPWLAPGDTRASCEPSRDGHRLSQGDNRRGRKFQALLLTWKPCVPLPGASHICPLSGSSSSWSYRVTRGSRSRSCPC